MGLQAKYDRLVQLEEIVRAEIANLVAAEQHLGRSLPMATGFLERSRAAAEGRLACIHYQQDRVRELM